MSYRFTPEDYNSHGMLRLPLWFWGILILQARTWLLFVMAGASRDQGNTLLALFYPDRQSFWLGIALGLPAALCFLLSGRRHLWPKSWRWVYGVMLLGLLLTLGLQVLNIGQNIDQPSLIDIVLALLDVAALAYWLLSQRLRAVFQPAE